jgi:hypothetical protein
MNWFDSPKRFAAKLRSTTSFPTVATSQDETSWEIWSTVRQSRTQIAPAGADAIV